jgi:hypothetical protein
MILNNNFKIDIDVYNFIFFLPCCQEKNGVGAD